MGVAVRYPANEFILRENAKRLVNAGVEAQRLKRDNPYLQETLRRLEQIQAEARQTMSEVSAHNERRLAALHGATRKNDRRLLDQMHQLLPRIEQRTRYRAEAPSHKESRQLVLATREAIAREEAIEQHAKDLPDSLAAVVRPSPGGVASRLDCSSRGGAGSFSLIGSSAFEKAAEIQSTADLNTTRALDQRYFKTDFVATAESLALPYIEAVLATLHENVATQFLDKLGAGELGREVADGLERLREGVGASITLARNIPLAGAVTDALNVTVPDAAVTVLQDFAHPAKMALDAVVAHLPAHGLFAAAASVQSLAMPVTKLIQPLASLAALLSRYPQIDAMHALSQRLRAGGACRDAAFQIVDKWENGLVDKIGAGNPLSAFITAMKSVCGEKPGDRTEGPAQLLWTAAQSSPTGKSADRDEALLVLATLFGGGNAASGVDEAVAAAVSDQASGIAAIDRRIERLL
ncbi:hypothetical protein C0Z17_12615 [Trinickia caryophylli]|nr:hypothetical protein C0Z17_12615 [Trinickia caryophylli]